MPGAKADGDKSESPVDALRMTPSSDCDGATCPYFERFDMHGWRPDPSLPDDENYMDAVILITRNSSCPQGGMGCVLVRPSSSCRNGDHNDETVGSRRRAEDQWQRQLGLQRRLYGSVIAASTNAPLFTDSDSDVHAEIGALGQASCSGNSTLGTTAYITMPPCKRCFASLVVSGVKRIVSRRSPPPAIAAVAKLKGVEMTNLAETAKEQQDRVNTVINNSRGFGVGKTREEIEELAARRKRRREERKARKERAREQKKNI